MQKLHSKRPGLHPTDTQAVPVTSTRQKQHSSGSQSTRSPYRVPRAVPRGNSILHTEFTSTRLSIALHAIPGSVYSSLFQLFHLLLIFFEASTVS